MLHRANKVFFTLMVYTMHDYTFFCNELNTFLYIPMFAVFALWSRSKRKNGRFEDAITDYPKTSFALIGVLDMMVRCATTRTYASQVVTSLRCLSRA